MSHAPKAVRTKQPAEIYQLHIELRHLEPTIWRRILVPASIRLPQLHVAILRSMGWEGGHLHEFVIGETHYGQPDPDFRDDPPLTREDRVTLEKALGGLGELRYVYDFGDDWEHKIKVENILPHDPSLHLPVCLGGANACPPEDVGGAPGYLEFLEAISNPAHEEHAEMLTWIGGSFDPTAFSLAEVNARLAEFKL
jgi:hypothetical protein